MSFLQQTLAALTANVQKFEAELAKSSTQPAHLWEAENFDPLDNVEHYVADKLFVLADKIRTDVAAISAIVTPTRLKHIALGLSALKASALNVAVSLGISDVIEDLGGEASLSDLASRLQVNENKLGRVIRLLATEYVYRETSPDVFANTRHSSTLLKTHNSEPFLSLIAHYNTLSSTGLLENMTDPATKDAFEEDKVPFCKTVSKNGETFMQYIMQPENGHVAAKVVNGVVPWLNRITRAPLVQGYPWHELNNSTVVDVGCGPGDSAVDVLRKYPKLGWVFQDLPPVIDGVKTTFPEDLKPRVDSGDIKFVAQDYLKPNESHGDVWYMRGVIREYDNVTAVRILKNVVEKMRQRPGSRLLVNEILVSSACTAPKSQNLQPVPSENIPSHQSAIPEVANLMTWNTFCFMGGYERSFSEYDALFQRVGLRVTRFFKLSSFTVMVEAVLD